jgi:hypothetical protein
MIQVCPIILRLDTNTADAAAQIFVHFPSVHFFDTYAGCKLHLKLLLNFDCTDLKCRRTELYLIVLIP